MNKNTIFEWNYYDYCKPNKRKYFEVAELKKTEQNLAIVSKTNILNQKQIIGSKIEIIEWKNNSWLKVMSELNIKIKLLNKNRNIGYKYTRNKFSLTSAGILGPELWLVNVLRADISSYIFDWKLVQFFYP